MGVVYMAEQQTPVRRRVALKVIKTGMDTWQVIARFEAERQALALMDHANIARVLDAGATDSGRPYFVMELVRGVPITTYCDQNNLPVHERLELFIQVCFAVQHAHQKGIIHRDLKPSNVLVTINDGRPVPKVIDFGVAKATGQRLTERTLFTAFAQMVGTPLYMSPEQAEMTSLDIDTRSDIYSLGVLLYELLTGTTPFDQERMRAAAFDEIRRIIREEEPPKPSTRISTLGESRTATAAHRQVDSHRLGKLVQGDLDWIVMKALEKDRTRRYDTASNFAADVLRHLSDKPVEACPPSAAYRFRKFARRNRTVLATSALILFFLVLMGGGVGWAMRDRAVRHAALEQGVNSALDEVQAWHQRENWPEAMAAVKRAEGLLAAGDQTPELSKRVNQWRANLETVVRLEEIALSNSDGAQFDISTAGHRQYEREFRALGIDIDGQTTEEAAARIRGAADQRPVDPGPGSMGAVSRNILVEPAPRRWNKPEEWWRRPLAVAQVADPDEMRVRVRLAVEKGDAAALLTVAKSPDSRRLPGSTLRFLAREVYWTAGDQDLAIEILRRAQRDHPNDFWINHALGNFLKHPQTRHPQFVESINYWTAAVSLRPQSAWAHLCLAESLLLAGRLDDSTAVSRKAIELKPDFAEAYHNLGNILLDQAKLDEAIEAYRKAIELKPDLAQPYSGLGNVLRKQGKLDDALAAYRKAIELQPNLAGAINNLGLDLVDQGKLDEAIAAYHKAIKLQPYFPLAYANLGTALQKQGKADEAIEAFRKAIELNPSDGDVYHNIGVNLADRGKHDEAIIAYRKAIELKPGDADIYYNLGIALQKQEKLDEAIAVYHKAIELKPKFAEAYTNLGNSLQSQGMVDESIAAYRKAIELKPDLANAHDNLGNSLQAQGKLDDALAAYRKAIELQPNFANAYDNLGTALQAQGKFDEAVVAYRKAIELQPDLANAYAALGSALQTQGKLDEANNAWRKAMALQPNDAKQFNEWAWALAVSLEPRQRDPPRAVELATKASELAPTTGIFGTHLVWLAIAPASGNPRSTPLASRSSCAREATHPIGSSWQWPTGSSATKTKPASGTTRPSIGQTRTSLRTRTSSASAPKPPTSWAFPNLLQRPTPPHGRSRNSLRRLSLLRRH